MDMDVQYFPLDQVKANPYQMRLSEDEAHIAGLAWAPGGWPLDKWQTP